MIKMPTDAQYAAAAAAIKADIKGLLAHAPWEVKGFLPSDSTIDDYSAKLAKAALDAAFATQGESQ